MKSKLLDEVKDLSFVVLYGSQLGQAESIAESIAEKAPEYDFTAQAFPLNAVADIKDLVQLNHPVVIVASTTGDGEPPENADKFWRKIRKKILKDDVLSSLNFTVLGLGDTNYNSFCGCGKEINRRLLELGAKSFYPPGWADDAVGLDLVVDDWLEGLWTAVESVIRPGSSKIMEKKAQDGGLNLPSCPPSSLCIEYHAMDAPAVNLEDPIQPYPLVDTLPVTAVITNAIRLTKPGSVKNTLELTLKFKSKKQDFEPGDAFGIVCRNSFEEVHVLLKRLGVSEEADKSMSLMKKENAKGKIPVHVPPGCTLRQTLVYFCDIRTPPRKAFLRLLAEYTADDSEKQKLLQLSSRQGSSDFENSVRLPGLSLLDILLTYPSCLPPVEVMIEHLPRLIPRAYSIASSPLESKESFTIAFNVISFSKEEGRKYSRLGVCTGWLLNMCKDILEKDMIPSDQEDLSLQFENLSLNPSGFSEPKEVVLYRRKNHNFRLPENLAAPIIMVGPGTGVAPFIGFLNHRNLQKKNATIGKLNLYFGCRNKDLDYLYEKQLTKHKSDEVLTNLYLSFSRDQDSGKIKYVQHNLELNKEELVSTILDNEGYLYVCGDAKNMAKNVRDTFVKCVQDVKGVPEEEAKSLVNGLVVSKRFLQDVWS